MATKTTKKKPGRKPLPAGERKLQVELYIRADDRKKMITAARAAGYRDWRHWLVDLGTKHSK